MTTSMFLMREFCMIFKDEAPTTRIVSSQHICHLLHLCVLVRYNYFMRDTVEQSLAHQSACSKVAKHLLMHPHYFMRERNSGEFCWAVFPRCERHGFSQGQHV